MATLNHVNIDDILAAARPHAAKKGMLFVQCPPPCQPRGLALTSVSLDFVKDWVTEMARMLKAAVDYSEEMHHDALVRNTSLQLCLSVMNHLGFQGEFRPRAYIGKFSLLSLNIRNIVILITIASNTPHTMREKLSPLDEHEVVDTLAGCAKWAIDLLSWLADALFSLMDDPEFQALLQPSRFTEISGFVKKRSDPSLQLVLCSSTRGYVSALCRRLQHLEALSQKAIEFYERKTAMQNAGDPSQQPKNPHILLQNAYKRMQHITQLSLVKISEFDRLLSTLGADVRTAYHTAFSGLASQQQQQQQQKNEGGGGGQAGQKQIDPQVKSAQVRAEMILLLDAQPTPPFLPVLKKFFGSDLRAFRAQTDPAKLYFADYGLLEVSDEPRVLARRKAARTYVDVFKRTEIVPPGLGVAGQQLAWRRCVRCAAVMEDVLPGSRPGFTFVLSQQRRCACGGFWALLSKDI